MGNMSFYTFSMLKKSFIGCSCEFINQHDLFDVRFVICAFLYPEQI